MSAGVLILRLTLVSSTKLESDVPGAMSLAMAEICSRNSIGPRTVPYGTPDITGESPVEIGQTKLRQPPLPAS